MKIFNDMKKYIYLFLLSILAISCGKDFLEENPQGVLSPDIFYASEEGMALATTNIPLQFSGLHSQAGHLAPYMGGDDLTAHPASNKLDFRSPDIFAASAVSDRIAHVWKSLYNTIRASNAIISNLEISAAPEDEKTLAAGTAYFYRGFCYSLLTRIFGEVPLITAFTSDIDYSVVNSPVADVYALVVSDLNGTRIPAGTVQIFRACRFYDDREGFDCR